MTATIRLNEVWNRRKKRAYSGRCASVGKAEETTADFSGRI